MSAETDALNLQVQKRIRRQRNARLFRGVGLTLLTTVAVVALAVSNRDQQAFKASRKSMQKLADQLATQPNVNVRLPSANWVFNARYQAMAEERGQAGVCARPVNLFLWPDGWHVLKLEGEAYAVEWMETPDFNKERAALGLERE